MKNLLFLLSMALLLICGNHTFAAETNSVPEYLQSITTLVGTDHSSGTAVIMTRKDANGNLVNILWTCAHVVENPYYNTTVHTMFDLFTMRSSTNNVSSPYLNIVTVKNGATNQTQLLKYSDKIKGDDLAILILKGKLITTNTVVFSLSTNKPALGLDIYSESCPYGESESFSKGNLSHVGNVIEHRTFDQTTCVIYPGSSGGGIYTPDGTYIGMSQMMLAAGMNYVEPIRKMIVWAQKENVMWALDPNVPMPSYEQLKKLKIED